MKKNVKDVGSSPVFVRHLAEAIILQCIEDLWDEGQKEGCLDFFSGTDFVLCADMAGLNVAARGRLLGLVNRVTGRKSGYPRSHLKGAHVEYSAGRG